MFKKLFFTAAAAAAVLFHSPERLGQIGVRPNLQ